MNDGAMVSIPYKNRFGVAIIQCLFFEISMPKNIKTVVI